MEALENNSEAMKTIVETYLVEETVSLIYDNEKLEKWNSLVTELGLSGQTQITKPEKSPVPFMYMKTSLRNVFECLCPRKVPMREFNCTPIPLEILDLIALSEKEQYFSKIEIWYDERTPDPACVGVIEYWILHEKGTYNQIQGVNFTTKKDAENYILVNGINADPYKKTWGDETKYYLLGKWGDVKRPFSELKQMAFDRYVEGKGDEYRKQIKDYQRKLDDLDIEANQLFN